MDNERDTQDETPKDGSAAKSDEAEIRRLWDASLSENSMPGQTIQSSERESGAGAVDSWLEAMPVSRIDGTETPAPQYSMAGGTIDGGGESDFSLPGGTIDSDNASNYSMAGGTIDSESVSEYSMAGGTIDAGDDALGETLIGDTVLQTQDRNREFRILDRLASGGMGDVFRADQVGLRRVVAFKRPKPIILTSERKLNAFIREATVTGDLEHPNIIPIYQNGIDEAGRPFYAMKLVRGIEWRYLLHPELARERNDPEFQETVARKSAEMDLEAHISILMKVCDAMAFAHSRRVVHRDLKPENVLVGEYGEVQVMDWGLAIDVSDRAPDETKAVSRMRIQGPAGTPAYMAPEMAMGEVEHLDERTDIYLLGAILFEILTGRPPHDGADIHQVLLAAACNENTDPRGEAPATPEELARIVMTAMSTRPEDRFPSVEDLQDAVREYLRHAQSIQISDNAHRKLSAILEQTRQIGKLSEAESGERYIRFAEVVASFGQALELWADNPRATAGLSKGLAAFVAAALDGEDLGLAKAQLNELENRTGPDDPDVVELRARWQKLDRVRRTRKRNLRFALSAAAILLIALVAGGTYSYVEISLAKTKAEDALDAAEAAKEDALRQKKRAEDNQKLAETETQRANDQMRKTETALQEVRDKQTIIESKNAELEKTLRDVREAKADADRQRNLAQENEEKAKKSEREAKANEGRALDAEQQARVAEQQAKDALKEAQRRERESRRNLAMIDIREADSLIASDRDYPSASRSLAKAIGILRGETENDRLDTTEPRTILADIFRNCPRLTDKTACPKEPVEIRADDAGEQPAILFSDGTVMRGEVAESGPLPADRAAAVAKFDGGWIILTGQGTLFRNGESWTVPAIRDSAVMSIAADTAGDRLAIGLLDGRLIVLDAKDGTVPVYESQAHMIGVSAVAFRPGSDQVLTAAADGRMRVFDVRRKERIGGHPGARGLHHATGRQPGRGFLRNGGPGRRHPRLEPEEPVGAGDADRAPLGDRRDGLPSGPPSSWRPMDGTDLCGCGTLTLRIRSGPPSGSRSRTGAWT